MRLTTSETRKMTSTMTAKTAAQLVIPLAELSTLVLWLLDRIPDWALQGRRGQDHLDKKQAQTIIEQKNYHLKVNLVRKVKYIDVGMIFQFCNLPCLYDPVENEGEDEGGECNKGGDVEVRYGGVEVLINASCGT